MKARLAFASLAFAALALAPAAAAAELTEARDWTLVLGEVERYVRGAEHEPLMTQGQRFLVRRVRERAAGARARALEKLRASERLLEALGLPPGKDKPPEPAEVAEKRRLYERDVAVFRARVAEADLALARADQLDASLASLTREQLLRLLLEARPSPLEPDVILQGVKDYFEKLGLILRSPAAWYRGLPPEKRESVLFYPALVMVLLAGLVSWVLRRALLGRFGRDPRVLDPTYARRFLAAVAEGVARGIVPAAVLGAFYLWFTRPGTLMGGLFGLVVTSGLWAALVFVLVVAFARAVLAPEHPAWRLTDLAPEGALRISRLVTLLAAVFGVDLFFTATARGMAASVELTSLYEVFFGALETLLILALSRGQLWLRAGEAPAAGEAGEAEAALPGGGLWGLLRWGAGGLSLAGLAAMAAGYPVLGNWLINNIILSGLAVGFLTLFRGLVHELADLLCDSAFVRERVGVPRGTLETVRAWERVVVDPLVVVVGLILILPFWGVPPEDLLLWALSVFSGFSIGKVRISILDIVMAIVVFFAAMAATRVIQRQVVERAFRGTRLAESVQHTLSAVVGYVGLVVAVILAIAVTGVDLTNIALVAGALSVGIGFGLQNVVNNFVSGFILLIERPIKVGDWVVVGEKEGFVKRVAFRATELETWQRASIIIPNAEILSSAVVNLTHRDNYGRIEVKVGVAYGSDVAKVRDILLAAARGNPKIAKYPAPQALFTDFGNSSLDFELRCFSANVVERYIVGSELRFEIDRRFREEGVVIPFPQRVVHFARDQGEEEKEEEAPGFRGAGDGR